MKVHKLIFGVDSEKGYKPFPIPARDTLASEHAYDGQNSKHSLSESQALSFQSEAFVDVEVAGEYYSGGNDADFNHKLPHSLRQHNTQTYTAQSQALDQSYHNAGEAPNSLRALFSDMRAIAREGYWYNSKAEEVFYSQAKLMENFTDNYHSEVEFSRYFPSYSKMDYAQLRSYFTWRSKVREGVVYETSTSYAFLYIYELLNNIGASSPQEGLNKLFEFWSDYRRFNSLFDKYVLAWFKDYHVFYPLTKSFQEFAQERQLQEYFPSIFCYGSDQSNSFDLFSSASKYDIRKSVFYGEETASILSECFFFVLQQLREAFRKRKRYFEDQVFYVMPRKTKWSPFSKAVFYNPCDQEDRSVVLSDREVYECKDGAWTAKIVIPSDPGSRLLAYIMKEIEAFLRLKLKFKHKLVFSTRSFKTLDLSDCEHLGIFIPAIIQEGCSSFWALHTRKTVLVDLGKLEQIRKDATSTQEKLLVPNSDDPVFLSPKLVTPIIATTQKKLLTPGTDNIWENFSNSLNEHERTALALMLEGENLKEFALQHNTMLEVLIDGLNQKAMDALGDTLIDAEDDAIFIFEDYREDIRKAVKF